MRARPTLASAPDASGAIIDGARDAAHNPADVANPLIIGASTMTIAATEEKLHRKMVNAWCLYGWANSAFATTIMAAMLPTYFSNVAAASLPKAQASSI